MKRRPDRQRELPAGPRNRLRKQPETWRRSSRFRQLWEGRILAERKSTDRGLTRELLLPSAVWASLVFSALVLLQNDLHGQTSQASAPDANAAEVDYLKSIGTVVSAVAGPGFAVWYAWYMTTKRLPEIEDGHKETMAQLRVDHKAEIAALINDFRSDVKGFQSDVKTYWDTKRSDDALWREAVKQAGGGK